ncbi:dicarboxylate/amino acid:cation symporter [Marinitenerispora sediminis]|uniref:Sodium:proton antiporter n=1 Tax=Marinitenerispora sediminis TaxID=1931232 RepID=A0A368T3L5_9ACTN|nr:dicarboxylate/amino acid:cation symporter [Marinitenerispora sediminis]RCV49669.1 sodium:proton antiporter [Marinitenerispora sediminis]RCV53195.1 sodium:proton antiporter [Marinitenerispora sediminis]RCV57320.1 sodium:proton antiporter [Marinitenerispora sediminis]
MLAALRRIPFAIQVLVALVLGVALGYVARQIGPVGDGDPNWLAVTLDTIGSTFVTLLRTIVPPLILLAVISSIASLRNVTNAARLAAQTLLWFAITALIAVAIGIALGLIVRPGLNSGVDAATAGEPGRTGSWLAFLESIVPGNFLGLSASTSADDAGVLSTSLDFNALQLITIAIAIGIAAVKVGPSAEPFLAFTRSALDVVLKVLWWVIRLAPLGTVGLLGNAVYSYGWTTIGALGTYSLTIYAGLVLVLFVVYPVLARLNGLSPVKFFTGVWPAVQLAFVSRSSLGTLPVTQRVTETNFGVPRGYASFAVPFGATTKMDGCAAIYPAVSAIFVAQFYGLPLGIADYLLIVFVSVIGSAATAGTTGATVMLTLTLSTLGLPLDGVGLLLAVDPILDMGRTAVNVAGQALIPAIVAKREKILDVERFHARRGLDGFVAAGDGQGEDTAREPAEGTGREPAVAPASGDAPAAADASAADPR